MGLFLGFLGVNFNSARMVKNPPTMQEIQVRSLGLEDPPGEGTGSPL